MLINILFYLYLAFDLIGQHPYSSLIWKFYNWYFIFVGNGFVSHNI
uniref:Uncharacterized protein n=1 Tax=Alsidium seaforthii TaxID=2007182 RepID=A0A1Z1MDW0_9FLOR|nr:hypothetical protein [Bryothamnion seaforthii]ARW63971.1 hypothetical protein [Bryothamnion seaforthii]